jgi:ribosomal subunit interface protein
VHARALTFAATFLSFDKSAGCDQWRGDKTGPDRRHIMPLRVSGKNINIGLTLRERISGRVEEATSKYVRGGYSGHATIAKEGFGFRTECVLHLDSGALLEAEGMAADAYESADQAAIRIEKRLRRYKRRRKGHQAQRGR